MPHPPLVAPSRGSCRAALPLIAVLFLCAFVFFYDLALIPLDPWDESRLANNALEMTRNANWLVTYYEGQPDLWNTKPPFLIWLIALSIKTFGANEWAVRLPSAIAASLTTVALYVFLSSHLRDRLAGFLASAALMSTLGYIARHAARSGDYDAMLTLWTTLYLLSFFLATEKEEHRSVQLFLFAVAAALAVMTKTVQGLVFFAPLGLYVIATPRFRVMLKSPSLYVAFAFPVVVASCFYIIREHALPGYLRAALQNDLLGRYREALDSHAMTPLFYLLLPRNLPWFAVLPFAAWLCYRRGRKEEKALFVFLATCYVGYFLVISMGKTKQGWYALPLYPLCALMCGIGLSAGIRHYGPRVRALEGVSGVRNRAFIAATFLVLTFGWALLRYYYPHLLARPADRYSFFLREIPQLMPDHKRIVVLHPGFPNAAGFDFYVAPARFYAAALADRGYQVSLEPLNKDYRPRNGEAVVSCVEEAPGPSEVETQRVKLAEAYGCVAWTASAEGPQGGYVAARL